MTPVIINKNTLITYIFFIFSPVLSLPLIMVQLFNNVNKGVMLLISAFYALLSFKYVPYFSNDKTRYVERYERFSNYSLDDLFDYFMVMSRPDFSFDGINFLFSRLGVDVNYLFLFVTLFTVFSFLTFIKCQSSKMLDKGFYFGLFTLAFVVFSLSLPSLFSGVRFLFAGSVFVWGIYFYLPERKRLLLSSCIFFIAVSIHFSFLVLVLCVYASRLKYTKVITFIILCISVLFLFASSFAKEVFEGLLSFISLPESYLNKTSVYLGENLEATANAKILHYLRHLWLFYLIAYLFLNYKNERYYSLIVNIVLIVSLVSFIDTAFYRYALFLKVVFVPYIFWSSCRNCKKKYYLAIFFLLYLVGFLVDVLVLRENIVASYSSGFWSTYHIFMNYNSGFIESY